MGKDKSQNGGLGRALVRRHNQLVQQSKEKGAAARQKAPIESITEVTDIDAVIELAAAGEAFESAELNGFRNPPTSAISLDGGRIRENELMTAEEKARAREKEEALHASSLRVPRRPPWTPSMSTEELDANERRKFLSWRRGLARLEENENLIITPFEKNLEIWRQLWRVLERSDLLVMVVDARDPLFYRCPDLETYAREIDEYKRTLLLINKADLLPFSIRQKWAKYFQEHGILYLFWSAKAAASELEGNPMNISKESSEDTKIFNREELLACLQEEAESALASKTKNPGAVLSNHVVVGFVGYPNVGKSSTINALAREKRAGVTSTPGKTKHFQTLIISEKLTLCDCPGLVFPSFSSSRYDMVASGVLPIDRMTEHREAVQVVANHVPREVLEGVYNIELPKPKQHESRNKAPSAQELLRAYCASRGHVISSGLPDETRAARQILKDYVDGKLPHFKLPPGTEDDNDLMNELSCLRSDHAADDDHFDEIVKEVVLEELLSFEVSVGGSRVASAPPRKKETSESHKHHKKPQRKKDRSWRVGNDGGDGMPVVRVFQKPPVRALI